MCTTGGFSIRPNGRSATSNGLAAARAVVLLILMGGCMGPPFIVKTLESDLGDSIVDRNLRVSGLVSGDMTDTVLFFQKGVREGLEKSGHLQSSETLGRYLGSAGMTCSSQTGTKMSCRLSRYLIQRLDSHCPPLDGTTRIEWDVAIAWDKNEKPVRPAITLNRTTRSLTPRVAGDHGC